MGIPGVNLKRSGVSRGVHEKLMQFSRVLVFDLSGISINKGRFPFHHGSHGKSGNWLEDQGKSGKLEIFWKKSGKSQRRKFLSMQIFNIHKKIICTQKCVQLNCI